MLVQSINTLGVKLGGKRAPVATYCSGGRFRKTNEKSWMKSDLIEMSKTHAGKLRLGQEFTKVQLTRWNSHDRRLIRTTS